MASRVSVYFSFVLIPYRRQAADFIQAYRRDYIESYVEVLVLQGLFVFLGVRDKLLSPLHIFLNLMDLNRRLFRTFVKSLLY